MRGGVPIAYRISKLGASLRQFSSDPFGAPPNTAPRRVVVTGLGLVTPLGVGVQAVWEAVLACKTGVRALTAEDLPQASMPPGNTVFSFSRSLLRGKAVPKPAAVAGFTLALHSLYNPTTN